MPLVSIDVHPNGQVALEADDIVLVHHNGAFVEISLRDRQERIFTPYETVADALAALRDPENRVFREGWAALD